MKLKNNLDFQWVGEGTPFQKRGSKIRYESFSQRDLKVTIGDFVLVRNDDALDPENVASAYVAQVKDLFDTGSEIDPFQAQVQWFSRIPELPAHAVKLLKSTGHECEVVQDMRSSWNNFVDAETIFQKCEVLFLAVDIDCEAVLSLHDHYPHPVFFCRYSFSGVYLNPVRKPAVNLVQKSTSVLEENSVKNSSVPHDEEIIEKTVENKISLCKKDMYCAIPTGTIKYPKVLIKKIEDKFKECNGNIGIFVADKNVEKYEDFTNIFLNTIKLEKQQNNKDTEKRPIITNLSIANNIPFEKEPEVNNLKNYDSDEEYKEVKTPKRNISKKNSTPLSNKSHKNLFSVPIRSSPRKNSNVYSTPKKRAKVEPELDVLCLKHSDEQVTDNSSDEDIAENFSSKLNLEKKLESNSKKETVVQSLLLRADEFKDKVIETNNEFTTKQGTPKTRRSTLKKNATPLSNRSSRVISSTKLKDSPNKYMAIQNADNSSAYSTPKKKAIYTDVNSFCLTRSGRRVKPVNYSENVLVQNCVYDSDSSNFSVEEDNSDDSSMSGVSILEEITPIKKSALKKSKQKTTPKRKDGSTKVSSSKKLVNLCIPERKTPLRTPKNALEESRQRLHVSAVPSSLPCRDEEYADIYNFVKGCLCAQTGGCMYISGVPGTGKTATVHEVMRNLEEEKVSGEIPIFTFVEVNGMWMTDPYQCYVHIFKALNGKNIAPQQAADLLEKRFTERGPKKDAVVLLVDELDRLWTRKQTVMYNIFDWPTKKYSKLIVLAIANTMDLPERMMMNRISSRLGLTRKTFQPYTFRQLQEIIMSRIQELKIFDPDAVQLVARKVAAVSGDARRALDICRFATEIVKTGQSSKTSQKVLVGMDQVDNALQQMFSSPVISAIRSSSRFTKLFFQSLLSELTRSGLEETTLIKVHQHLVSTCRFEGFRPPNSTDVFKICADLAASHLILVDNFKNDLYMKIRLNISSDDVSYALTLK